MLQIKLCGFDGDRLSKQDHSVLQPSGYVEQPPESLSYQKVYSPAHILEPAGGRQEPKLTFIVPVFLIKIYSLHHKTEKYLMFIYSILQHQTA